MSTNWHLNIQKENDVLVVMIWTDIRQKYNSVNVIFFYYIYIYIYFLYSVL